MSQTPALLKSQWGYFISRLLIFIGLVLFFTAIGAVAASLLVKYIYGIELAELASTHFGSMQQVDPNLVAAHKLFQVVAGSVGIFLLPALLFPYFIHTKPVSYLRLNTPTPWFSWPIAVLLLLVSLPLVSWLIALNQQMQLPAFLSDFERHIRSLEDQNAALTKVFVSADNGWMLLLNLVIVAVIPAICEEFFFRGVIQNFIFHCFHNRWLAIVFAALLFSAVHGQFYGFVPRVVLGMLLGYVYAISGNMWVVVLTHFFNNALSLVTIYLSKIYPNVAAFNENYSFGWPMVVISAVFVAVLGWWYQKLFHELVIKTYVHKVNEAVITKAQEE